MVLLKLFLVILVVAMPMGISFYGKTKELSNAKYFLLAALSIFIIWSFINIGAVYSGYIIEKELYTYDLNGDGSFSGEEISPEMEKAMYAFTSDTGRALAPFTGIIMAPRCFVWVIV